MWRQEAKAHKPQTSLSHICPETTTEDVWIGQSNQTHLKLNSIKLIKQYSKFQFYPIDWQYTTYWTVMCWQILVLSDYGLETSDSRLGWYPPGNQSTSALKCWEASQTSYTSQEKLVGVKESVLLVPLTNAVLSANLMKDVMNGDSTHLRCESIYIYGNVIF